MTELGNVAMIWRYPVKSLAAQPLGETAVEPGGLPGDRTAALHVVSGHAREGKTYRGKEHRFFHTVAEPEEAAAMASSLGVQTTLHSEMGVRYFDAAPVSLLFDRWVDEVAAALGAVLDPLRWRPNFFVKASAGFRDRETALCGALIAIGNCVLRVREPIDRCVVTTYDVATGERDERVLSYVARERGNAMGVYCDVELAGTVRVGDSLRLRAR
jgi:uncharacterized protein YcbX